MLLAYVYNAAYKMIYKRLRISVGLYWLTYRGPDFDVENFLQCN